MMGELFLELSEMYDLILFDTRSVLAVTDAQILGNRCDGVILVLRSNQTEKKEFLDKSKVNLMGAIITGVDQKEVNYNYYYGSTND